MDDEFKAQHRQHRRQMINDLSFMARGVDRFGNPISMAAQVAAMQQYEQLRIQEAAEEAAERRMQMERDAIALNNDVEHRRLDIESEKVAVQKAEVLVRALEVAASAGLNGEQILSAFHQLTDRMLPAGTSSTLRVLEDKKSG